MTTRRDSVLNSNSIPPVVRYGSDLVERHLEYRNSWTPSLHSSANQKQQT